MKRQNIKKIKNAFTLVELLAVIVILAVILVIAVPQIMNTIKDTTKASFESSAKMVAAQVENQYTVAQTLSKEFGNEGNCKQDWAGLNDTDYESCTYKIESDGTAKITLVGKGKFKDLKVIDGTRSSANAIEDNKPVVPVLNCTYDGELVPGAEFIHNQYTYRYKQEYNWGDSVDDYSLVDLEQDGWGVILTDKKSKAPVNTPVCTYINGKPLLSTSGMFSQSAATSLDLSNFNTSSVTNMSGMFRGSSFTSLDLSSFDTSNVTNMFEMFADSAATSLVLSSFDTSNVTDMRDMFLNSAATSLDLSNFDTSNVIFMSYMFADSAATSLDLSDFDTSKVVDMYGMFAGSAATSLDLSSFDTSKVEDMGEMFASSAATILDLSSFDISDETYIDAMFSESAATIGYAKTQADADMFNDEEITFIPSTLTFTLKPNS